MIAPVLNYKIITTTISIGMVNLIIKLLTTSIFLSIFAEFI